MAPGQPGAACAPGMRSLPCEAPGAPSAAEDHAGRVLSVPRGRMSEGVSLRACGQCNRQAEHLMVCSGCRAAWYCGQDHQRLHWKKHKVFCKPKNGATQSSSQKNEARSKKVSPKTNFTLDSAVLDAMVSGRDVSDCTLPFQSNGDGVRGGRRRPRGGDPEMSAPLDPSEAPEAAPLLPRPRTPSLQHVEMFTDAQSLEEVGFNQNWFNRLAQFVISDLNMYGVCVIENFLGKFTFCYFLCASFTAHLYIIVYVYSIRVNIYTCAHILVCMTCEERDLLRIV